MTNLILAGDIGGTKTIIGLFERATGRPRRRSARTYASLDFRELPDIINLFLRDESLDANMIAYACFGVAGPVIDAAAELTNVPWRVDARAVAKAFGFPQVRLLNDLEAMAYGVTVLDAPELHTLQPGVTDPDGNIAIIAAGTGLGEGMLHRIGGRWIASPTEAGHADFAARTEREIALTRDLTARYGRADVEHVISGRGLVNIHRVTHPTPCRVVTDLDHPSAAALISTAALERRCPCCVETLEVFVGAYGAEAGNLGLRTVATGGVFVGGGIAPKILPALTTGSFVAAFVSKPPLESLLRAMPLKVILNPEAGLLGAAAFANFI